MYSVDTSSFDCQPSILSVVPSSSNSSCKLEKTEDQDLFSKLLELDEIDLKALKSIGNADGITAKVLGQKINLSRYAALKRAQNLVKKNFVISESIGTAKTGIKPTYFFRLARNLTLELISSVLFHKRQEQAQQEDELWASIIEQTFVEELSRKEKIWLTLTSQDIGTLRVLDLIASSRFKGLTYAWLEKHTYLIQSSADNSTHPCMKTFLQQAIELNLLTLKKVPKVTTEESLYCLAPGVSSELIELALIELEPVEPIQGRRRRRESFENKTCSRDVKTFFPTEKVAQSSMKEENCKEAQETIDVVLEVLQEVTQKVLDLETRLKKLESRLTISSSIDPKELLAILRAEKS